MPPDTSTSPSDPSVTSPPPAFSLDDAMRSTLKSGQQKADTESKKVQSDTSETLKKIERADETIQNSLPPPPPPIEPFQPPKPTGPAASPLGEFLGAMALPLAIFGGALTHQPLINAMNAGAMVNDAWTRKNGDDFNSAFAQWQAHTNYAIKLHEYQHEFYNDELNRAKEGKTDALAELEVKLKAMHDEAALQAYYTGGPEMLFNFLKYRDGLAAKQPEIMQKAQDAKVAFEAGQSYIQQLGHQPGTVGPPEQREAEVAKYRELTKPSAAQADQGPPLDEETLDYLAKRWKRTGVFPPMYRDAESRKQIMERAAHMPSEGGDKADVGADLAGQAGFRADQASLGNITRIADSAEGYERTALHNMDIVLEKMPKGVATEWGPWLNEWIQSGRTNFGSADVPPYATALVTVANEYAKVMSGSTGSQGSTVDSRREAGELLNKAQNTEQVLGVLDVMKRDMANKKASYRDQRQEIEGRISGAGSSSGGATGLPPDLPSPAGHAEGSVAKDASGKVVAKIVNGQWAAP